MEPVVRTHKLNSIILFDKSGVNFPICSNNNCDYYWDTTPSSDPHSDRCLMCGVRQVGIAQMISLYGRD